MYYVIASSFKYATATTQKSQTRFHVRFLDLGIGAASVMQRRCILSDELEALIATSWTIEYEG